MTSKNKTKPWEEDLDSLSPTKQRKYDQSLEVLRKMRKGETLTHASKELRISPKTVKKYVGTVFQKISRKIIPIKEDRLLRRIKVFENGETKAIQIRGNKNASKLMAYHNSVERRIDGRNDRALLPFESMTITDSKGKKYLLETNVEKLRSILERLEEDYSPYGETR